MALVELPIHRFRRRPLGAAEGFKRFYLCARLAEESSVYLLANHWRR